MISLQTFFYPPSSLPSPGCSPVLFCNPPATHPRIHPSTHPPPYRLTQKPIRHLTRSPELYIRYPHGPIM